MISVLIAGDFCPQRRVAALFDKGDYASVLGEIRSSVMDADYRIVNFECPVSEGNGNAMVKKGPNLRCTEKGLEAVRWVGFTKPLLTLNGGKGGMRRCDNETELCSALDYIVKYRSGDEKVLVEDYLEIEKEFALVGFSDGENVAIPGLFQLLVISKNSPGIALQGRVLPIDGDEIIGLFKDFVRKMGFVGLFDIDFFFCKGKFFFGEMNLRFGGSGYAITKMGVNLPQMMIESFNGGHNGLLDNRIEGTALYTNDRMCLDDWKAGHFSYKAFRGYLNTSDFRLLERESKTIWAKAVVVLWHCVGIN